MIPISFSQAGQDLFVDAVVNKTDGRFLDIGASHPVEISNTFALEKIGWSGFLCDIDPGSIGKCRELRRAPAACFDATTCDWKIVLGQHQPNWTWFPLTVQYISLDIDQWTHLALKNLLRFPIRSAVVTLEHDHYQNGDALRLPNRAAMHAAGYELIAADVHSNGCNFEDWFVLPDIADMEVANRFRSTGLDWRQVLQQGGIRA